MDTQDNSATSEPAAPVEEEALRPRSRSHSLYGGNPHHTVPLPVIISEPSAQAAPNVPAASRRRSLKTSGSISAEGGGAPSPVGESPSSRRRSSGKLQAHKGQTSLSKKTLHIVSNLEGQAHSSRKEVEDVEEERRLALEEKKRQGLGQGLYGSKDADCDHTIRVLLLGDSGVGKTSLMHRFSEDAFAVNLLSTMGVDFKVRHMVVDGKKVKCQVWDTAGQEKFHVITRAYYKGANGIALIYDVTDPDSFKNVNYWMANIQTHADEKVHLVLLGNKIDLPDQRQIQPEQGEATAKEFGIKFFETSAKDGTNVERGFNALVSEVVERMEATQQAEGEAASAAADGHKGHHRKDSPAFKNPADKCRLS